MDTIKDIAHTLANLAEPIDYLDEVEECKNRPGDYYTGVYEGIVIAMKALDKSFNGDFKDISKLVYEMEKHNVFHWEAYGPSEGWRL